MKISRRPRLLPLLAILILAVTGAACAKRGTPQEVPSPSPSTAISETPTPIPSPSPSPSPSIKPTLPAPVAKGPVWPLEPRAVAHEPSALLPGLKAIRTGRHNTYDRVAFEFSGLFGYTTVRYVPQVHADPSGLVVALRGNAFLEVTIHGAYARWPERPLACTDVYTGPDSVTPGYPTLKQITLSGDVDAVLSFGIGLDHTAGFQVAQLEEPYRLVIDVAHTPAWRMWPDISLTHARQVQASFDTGHVPWRSDVVAYYAKEVYGWSNPLITQIPGTDQYWVSELGSNERIKVRQVWPFAAANRTSIAEIADVR